MNVFEFCSNSSFNALFEQIDFISKCNKSGRKQFIVVPDRFSLTMEKLVMELIGDKLLELSRYVVMDTLNKKMIIDKTALTDAGYILVTH